MNIKLFLGIALFLVGMIAAAIGIANVGFNPDQALVVTQDNVSEPLLLQGFRNIVLPPLAGFCLAVGGLLIGLSLGDWKHPRTHLRPGDEIVDPEVYHKMKHV